MKRYDISTTGKFFIVLVVFLIIGVIVYGIATAYHQKHPLYGNCSAYKAAGIHDIPQDSPYYASSLDRDGDGIACETYIP